MAHSSSESIPVGDMKAQTQHLEVVPTNDRVPGHDNYYEKDGLRTEGDGVDHEADIPMTFNRFMSFAAMAFLWTASQIPVYLFGGIPPIIYQDIGGEDRWIWYDLS